MTRKILIQTLLFVGCINISIGQTTTNESPYILKWKNVSAGMWHCEVALPESSIVGDSKCSIVKIDPQLNEFYLLSASEYGKKTRSAQQWGDEFSMNFVFNAGMYFLSNQSVSRGYMKNYEHLNNPKINPNYNIILALNPKNIKDASLKIYDLSCDSFASFSDKYNTYSQIMRMVDCDGNGMNWKKRAGQKCSMIFIATDPQGYIYVFFVRSPYTHNYMINFLLSLPIKAKLAGYLEGGPETSLYLRTDSCLLQKWGSYVSQTYETDKNDHYWPIPNVIGVRSKK